MFLLKKINMTLKNMPMFRLKYLLVTFYVVQVTYGQLRIRQGMDLPEKNGDKRYMVYLTLSTTATVYYDEWICGGAIVSKNYILTSAACVEDVSHMYAIAGYKEYIRFDQISTNLCTKTVRKKIIEYCVPSSYDFSYQKLDKWAHIDIAVAKVESPYVLDATEAEDGCSYPPTSIDISYYRNYQTPGVDAFVLGWGHNVKMRQPEDPLDYNSKDLKYATAHIVEKKVCKEEYAKTKQLANNIFDQAIEKYMICTKGKGNFDFEGTMIDRTFVDNDGCEEFKNDSKLRTECIEKNNNITYVNVTLAKALRTSFNVDDSDLTRRTNVTVTAGKKIIRNDKKEDLQVPGICQNDHGGPLVTWVGSHEYLIGIASVFMIYGRDQECIGPYLFTSTHCNSHFLRCVLGEEALPTLRANGRGHQNVVKVSSTTSSTTEFPPEEQEKDLNFSNLRRDFSFDTCNQTAKQKGYEIIDKKISWRNHPDGPAENEIEEDKLKELEKTLKATENPLDSLNDKLTSLDENHDKSQNDNQEHSLEDNPTYNMSDFLSDYVPSENKTYNINNLKDITIINPIENLYFNESLIIHYPNDNPVDTPIYEQSESVIFNPNTYTNDRPNNNVNNKDVNLLNVNQNYNLNSKPINNLPEHTHNIALINNKNNNPIPYPTNNYQNNEQNPNLNYNSNIQAQHNPNANPIAHSIINPNYNHNRNPNYNPYGNPRNNPIAPQIYHLNTHPINNPSSNLNNNKVNPNNKLSYKPNVNPHYKNDSHTNIYNTNDYSNNNPVNTSFYFNPNERPNQPNINNNMNENINYNYNSNEYIHKPPEFRNKSPNGALIYNPNNNPIASSSNNQNNQQKGSLNYNSNGQPVYNPIENPIDTHSNANPNYNPNNNNNYQTNKYQMNNPYKNLNINSNDNSMSNPNYNNFNGNSNHNPYLNPNNNPVFTQIRNSNIHPIENPSINLHNKKENKSPILNPNNKLNYNPNSNPNVYHNEHLTTLSYPNYNSFYKPILKSNNEPINMNGPNDKQIIQSNNNLNYNSNVSPAYAINNPDKNSNNIHKSPNDDANRDPIDSLIYTLNKDAFDNSSNIDNSPKINLNISKNGAEKLDIEESVESLIMRDLAG